MVPVEKFSDLPAAATPTTGNTFVGVQSGVDVQYSFAQVAALASSPVASVAGRTGAVVLAVSDVSGAAPLASPTFTGTMTMPDGSSWASSGISGPTQITLSKNVAGVYAFLGATNPSTNSSAACQGQINNNVGAVAFGLTGGNWTPGMFGAQPNQLYFNNTIAGGSISFLTTTGSVENTALLADQNGLVVVSPGFTVTTLPTGVLGARAYVNDATSPTFLGALTGGGSVKCPVFFNGSAWVAG